MNYKNANSKMNIKLNYKILETFTFKELEKMALDMHIKKQKSSKLYIESITKCLKEYEKYKYEKVDKYTKISKIGSSGKEGIVYLVKNNYKSNTDNTDLYAMKCFKKNKSSKKLKLEVELQKKCALIDISPSVIDYDTISKYIVMEKMDINLLDVLKNQNGELTISQQKNIINIFQKLDNIGIFHSDPNPLNFMLNKNSKKIYIIDFGFSKKIDTKLIKKYNTSTPNMKYMVIGFILKIKEFLPNIRYKLLEQYLSKENKHLFNLN